LRVRRRIGYLPENAALRDNLSGLETLKFFARLKGLDTAGCAALLTKVGLEHAGDRPVRAYSKGMRQRLGFAQALQGNPQVLFLDEPTNHLDIQHQVSLMRLVAALPLTSIIALHDLNHAAMFCDALIVMQQGKIVAHGTPTDVLTEALLRDVFRVEARVMASPFHAGPHIHILREVVRGIPSSENG